MARIIVCVSAGKQMGKTHLCVNLAVELARRGYGTCLFHADADDAAVYRLLQIRPPRTLEDLIENRIRLDGLVRRDLFGIDFIAGTPGMEKMGSLMPTDRDRLLRAFTGLNRYDYLILDTSSGLSRNVAAMCNACPEVILVVTPASGALTDAYCLLKAMSVNGFAGSALVVITLSRDVKAARLAYTRFKAAVMRYLPIRVEPLGSVFTEPQTTGAEGGEPPVVLRDPQSEVARCVQNIAAHLAKRKPEDLAVSAFWSLFLENLKQPFQLLGKGRGRGVLKPEGRGEVRAAPPDPKAEPRGEAVQPDATVPPHGEVHTAVKQLQEAVAQMSRELSELKRSFSAPPTPEKIPESGAVSPGIPERRVLDFDEFLRKWSGWGK